MNLLLGAPKKYSRKGLKEWRSALKSLPKSRLEEMSDYFGDETVGKLLAVEK